MSYKHFVGTARVDPLAVFQDQNQAFCANTWCSPGTNNQTVCQCPIFNDYGLAPYSSFVKYQNDPNVIVSTYDILQGAEQPDPKMCFGKYVTCYGQPCERHPKNQGLSNCQCKIENGPFLTASDSCGPDSRGWLPNGAAISKSASGIATANTILQIMKSQQQ